MGCLQSYKLQKINDEIILDRMWLYTSDLVNTKQVKLCSLELMKLRIYIKNEKLNCITCNETNLGFEKGYVDCFRNHNHRIELINDDPHLFCKLFGFTKTSNNSPYEKYCYCITCAVYLKKIDKNCVCCGTQLRYNKHKNQSLEEN